jgi:Tfp pilus assembly protein FimT
MKSSPAFKTVTSDKGVSVLDLLICVMIIATIICLVLPTILSAHKSLGLANAAQEFSSFLQQARSDSRKIHAQSVDKMAQVTVINDRYYYVMTDSNGDGVLDPPIVVNLENRRIRMDGPFPRTFRFDWLGRVVDANQNIMTSPAVTFSGSSAKTVVKCDIAGQPVVMASK